MGLPEQILAESGGFSLRFRISIVNGEEFLFGLDKRNAVSSRPSA
jgi:hypothetical protein